MIATPLTLILRTANLSESLLTSVDVAEVYGMVDGGIIDVPKSFKFV